MTIMISSDNFWTNHAPDTRAGHIGVSATNNPEREPTTPTRDSHVCFYNSSRNCFSRLSPLMTARRTPAQNLPSCHLSINASTFTGDEITQYPQKHSCHYTVLDGPQTRKNMRKDPGPDHVGRSSVALTPLTPSTALIVLAMLILVHSHIFNIF